MRDAGHSLSPAAFASPHGIGSAARSAPSSAGRRRVERAAKRALDIAAAAAALGLLMPLLVLIGLLIWLTDGGAPIFRHRRVGRDGRPFDCLKFRSMVPDGDALLRAHIDADPAARAEWEENYKLADDPRVTPLGRVLRRTSLDEVPQLWNVLRGEMSLVGPRPIVPAEVARYGAAFATCFSMSPGLTGLWQVTRHDGTRYAERVRLDLDYAGRWRLARDLAILARTPSAMLARRGGR